MPEWKGARARLDRALHGSSDGGSAQPIHPAATDEGDFRSAEPRRARGGAWRQYAALLAFVGLIILFCSPSRPPARRAVALEAEHRRLLLEAEQRAQAAEKQAEQAALELQALRSKMGDGVGTAAAAATTLVSPPPPPAAAALSAALASTLDCTTDAKVMAEDANATITTYGREYGNRRRLGAICKNLAPAVAVRPAPAPKALSARLAVELSPWVWADSPAKLSFDPDDLTGALATPWGEGRWGSLPRHPNVLWATFAGRTHLLLVRGCTLLSHRCEDNQSVVVRTSQRTRFQLGRGGDAEDEAEEDEDDEDDDDDEEKEREEEAEQPPEPAR
jgi:hypothetical protein